MPWKPCAPIWVGLIVLVALRAVAVFLPPMWVWGADVQRYLGLIAGWGLWILGVLSLLPAVSARLRLDRLGDFVAGSRWAPWMVGATSALLVWLMPDRVWFVGDFLMRQGNVESNFLASNYWGALPLDSFLHLTLLRPIGFGSPESANSALRLLGAVEAGILGVMAVQFSRVFQLRDSASAVVVALTLFGGYLTMFTGLGKPASEMCLVVLGVGIASVRAIRGQGGLLPVGFAAAIGFALHRSSVALVPVLVVVGLIWWRMKKRLGWREVVAIALPLGAAAWTFPYIASFAMRYDLTHHFLTASVRQQGLLGAAFSLEHLHGLANLALVLSPVGFLGITMIALRPGTVRSPDGAALTALFLAFLPLLLFVHPQQGLFRDWDVFAPAGMALSMLAAYVLAHHLLPDPHCRWLALPLVLAAMIPSVQWLVLNRESNRGLARVRTNLVAEQTPSDLERALTWDFLTARYLRLNLWGEAADAAEHAAELAPHRRILLMWALAETMKGDDDAAESVYRKVLEKNPDDPLGWLGLAGIAVRRGDREDYREAAEKLRTFEADPEKREEIRRHLEYYPQVGSGESTSATPDSMR